MIVVIPARSNSVRCPDKNFRPFCNTTLIDLAVAQAVRTGMRVYVSTDNADWKPKEAGVKVILRPAELCTSAASTWLAVEHVGYCLPYFGDFMILQPTSPLRSMEDLAQCNRLSGGTVENPGSQNVTSVDKWGSPNGAIYIRKWHQWYDKGIEYHMPWHRGCDIDTEEDFQIAETIMSKMYVETIPKLQSGYQPDGSP